MDYKTLHPITFKDRKIYNISKPTNYPLKIIKTLQSTAIHSKETKRRGPSSFNPYAPNEQTKKQVPIFSSQQLKDNDHSFPYSSHLMNHLKDIESEFIIKTCHKDLNMFGLCRLRFIKRLKEAKIGFNLLNETVFLAVHLYDKYFELEAECRTKLMNNKLDREIFEVVRNRRIDSKIIRFVIESEN